MSTTRATPAWLLVVISILIFVSISLSASEYQGAGHTIPAFVDVEFTEQHVKEPLGKVAINLVRSGDYRLLSTVDYRTVEAEASEGRDYKGSGGTITFQPGESLKTIYIDLLPDEEVETPESFRFELSSPSPNTVLSRSETVVWIDDVPSAISQPSIEIASQESGILISWEATELWNLERNSSPSDAQWEQVPENPTVYGVRYEVQQSAQFNGYFYRLRRN